MDKKTNGIFRLAKKAGAIISSALAALAITHTQAVQPTQQVSDGTTIDFSKQSLKKKPMTVLKLNTANPEQSQLIAQHRSHSSHSSHSSHRSHYSHRSSSFV